MHTHTHTHKQGWSHANNVQLQPHVNMKPCTVSNGVTQTLALPLPWPLTGRAWDIHTACLTFVTVRVVAANATRSRSPPVTDFSWKAAKQIMNDCFITRKYGLKPRQQHFPLRVIHFLITLSHHVKVKTGMYHSFLTAPRGGGGQRHVLGRFTPGERTPDIPRIRGWVTTIAGVDAFVTESSPACREPNPSPSSP